MAEVTAGIFKHWAHSYEEDIGDVEVYRPDNYPFPPSRFRRAFNLSADGQLTYYDLGPTDKPLVLHGRWSSDSSGRIRLEFDDPRRPPETLGVVSIEEDVLKIMRLDA